MIYPHKMYKGIKKLSLFKIKYIDTANKNDNAKLNTCTRLNLISTTFHSLSLPSFLCLPHAPASTLAITCTSTSTYTYIYIYIYAPVSIPTCTTSKLAHSSSIVFTSLFPLPFLIKSKPHQCQQK